MKDLGIDRVAVVGVGLLGGSIGLAVKAVDERTVVAGIGRRRSSLDRALDAGAIDTGTLDVREGIERADIVVLATPLDVYEEHLLAMRGSVAKQAIVTDVGSTKAIVVRLAEAILGKGGPFVGSHPMAGGERRGVQFARADLFNAAACIVTPTRHTPASKVARVVRFWEMLGSATICMDPVRHDRAVARVSHLPHILAALVVMGQKDSDLSLAGRGFLDTTRIASGDPGMWREIILTNRKALLSAIDRADDQLMRIRDLIETGDAAGIERYLAAAKKRRDALLGRWMGREGTATTTR